jgi:hypothetical protein
MYRILTVRVAGAAKLLYVIYAPLLLIMQRLRSILTLNCDFYQICVESSSRDGTRGSDFFNDLCEIEVSALITIFDN